MENNDLLQAIGQMMDEKLAAQDKRTDEKLETVRAEVGRVEHELTILIEDLEKGQQAIRTDISKVNHALEPKINAVYDGLEGILRRNEQTDRHEKALADHDNRIYALEHVVNK